MAEKRLKSLPTVVAREGGTPTEWVLVSLLKCYIAK
jgi:hypothetical protein